MKRFFSLRLFSVGIMLFLAFSLAFDISPVYATASAVQGKGNTYTVYVGAENAKQGTDLNRFYPSKLTIHVGDTVKWVANSFELHTVTFLADQPMFDFVQPIDPSLNAPSPLELNPKAFTPVVPPNGQYDGASFANSGLIGKDPGMAPSFSLTFTKEGSFMYVCIVHGMSMMGMVDVVGSDVPVLSPETVTERAQRQIGLTFFFSGPAAQIARLDRIPDEHHADGTTTHYIMVGAGVGVFDLMRFFPSTVNAKPGDTIVWYLGPTNMAPHTVTFLNGAAAPELVVPFPANANPPQHLLLNSQVVLPANVNAPLNGKGYVNSGLMDPTQGPQTFSLVIDKNFTGVLNYICVLHDESGMVGSINVSK